MVGLPLAATHLNLIFAYTAWLPAAGPPGAFAIANYLLVCRIQWSWDFNLSHSFILSRLSLRFACIIYYYISFVGVFLHTTFTPTLLSTYVFSPTLIPGSERC
ncbi:hypothetical protein BS47DRAFT_1343709 [Hydnum rufescens UP504]|uniref:Uncharacterized protein n=1 Tax=Hydnum rufescens UP504 TaxID=1448309 RepID=A0A9P6AXM2_9AGAM|nr:hypothetical protein BS47DRAFT_1343709 [Hydnum rufescens UP504]